MLATLPATRRALLIELKREGEARAEALAAALGITVSAVRQHLTALAGEGLVAHREVKDGPGRPKHVYHLAPAAEHLFPKTYGELATELLDHLQAEDPGLVERLFERRRRRRAAAAKARLAGKPFGDRVAELARILDDDGYLADFEALPDGGFRITEHNCAVLDVARRVGHAGTSELAFLRAALPDARVERVQHIVAGAHVCSYEVRPKRKPRRSAPSTVR
jgi:DeoR family suf operon transcriptional repressor